MLFKAPLPPLKYLWIPRAAAARKASLATTSALVTIRVRAPNSKPTTATTFTPIPARRGAYFFIFPRAIK